MHIYRTEKVNRADYFRAKLSQFMSEMMKTVIKGITKRGEWYEVGNHSYYCSYTGKCLI